MKGLGPQERSLLQPGPAARRHGRVRPGRTLGQPDDLTYVFYLRNGVNWHNASASTRRSTSPPRRRCTATWRWRTGWSRRRRRSA